MNLLKALWRLGLCTLFVIGLMYGSSVYATEPEAPEEAVHEMQEMTEEAQEEMTEEAQEETTEEAQEEGHEVEEE
ncbi:MAG: hypothetical protein PVG97_03270 [Syntrophobacterales bacterium]